MDKASDLESEDCAFESRRGPSVSFFKHLVSLRPAHPYTIHCSYGRPRGLMHKASDFESERVRVASGSILLLFFNI